MEIKKVGRKRINQEAFDKILAAGRKEIIIMKKSKWNLVTPPGAHLLRKYLKKEYIVKTLADDSGWLIRRK